MFRFCLSTIHQFKTNHIDPKMQTGRSSLFLAWFLVCFYTGEASQYVLTETNQCESLNDGPFARCGVVGYNNTFPFPRIMGKDEIRLMSGIFTWILEEMENCSQNAVADTMTCSMFVPKCVTSSADPVLPCRRVCSEYLKQCGVKLEGGLFAVLLGICEILPNKTASSGECLEPTNFKVNNSIPDPLDQPCQPLIIPACQGKGYTHTLMQVETQKEYYGFLYGSNYTKENASKGFPRRLEARLRRYPKCRANMEKLFCADVFSPCFPHEGPAYYSLCQSGCQEIYDDCPSWQDDHFVQYVCTVLAEGNNTAHGYCKHTRWPRFSDWMVHRKEIPTPKGHLTTKEGISAGVIAAAVIVPVVFVGAFIGAAIFWKKRQMRAGVGYKRHGDDTAPLDT